MNNIEKQLIHNKIMTSFYMNRGDINKVVEETGYPAEHVRKVTEKLRRGMKRDVSYQVGYMIYNKCSMGMEQRTALITEQIFALRSATTLEVSPCCKKPVMIEAVEVDSGTLDAMVCSQCHHPVHGMSVVHNMKVHSKIIEYLKELRTEDEHMVKFAQKMHFIGDDIAPPLIQTNYINVPIEGQQKKVKQIDNKILEETDEMKGQDRRYLLNRLENIEKQIVDESEESKDSE